MAGNGKSTVSKMYQRVPPIYWAEISKDTVSSKNKGNQKDLYNYQTSRFIYCDEIDIYHLDIGQLKLICEQIMTIRPLYQHTKSFENHSHAYITRNNEPKLRADNGLLRRGLLIETKNKFYPLAKYNQLPENLKQNAKIANPDLVNDLDNVEDKIAWLQLHLKYTIEMYTNNALQVDLLQINFYQYCLERDNWVLLINDRLEITDNEEDRMSRSELTRLYNSTYNAEVSDDTAREEEK